jgi:hypothetical protein
MFHLSVVAVEHRMEFLMALEEDQVVAVVELGDQLQVLTQILAVMAMPQALRLAELQVVAEEQLLLEQQQEQATAATVERDTR